MLLKRKRNQKYYIPKNPDKYSGRWPIVIRSEWERKFCQWLDANPNVVEWKSESHCIRYDHPFKKGTARYYPDFFVKSYDSKGKIKEWLVEIKPWHETNPPKITKRKSKKTIFHQKTTYEINQAKWRAAKEYCRKMGYEWKLLTEKELFRGN